MNDTYCDLYKTLFHLNAFFPPNQAATENNQINFDTLFVITSMPHAILENISLIHLQPGLWSKENWPRTLKLLLSICFWNVLTWSKSHEGFLSCCMWVGNFCQKPTDVTGFPWALHAAPPLQPYSWLQSQEWNALNFDQKSAFIVTKYCNW